MDTKESEVGLKLYFRKFEDIVTLCDSRGRVIDGVTDLQLSFAVEQLPKASVSLYVEAWNGRNIDHPPQLKTIESQNDSLLLKRIAELEREACRFYRADGTFEELESPEAVKKKRVEAAKRLSECDELAAIVADEEAVGLLDARGTARAILARRDKLVAAEEADEIQKMASQWEVDALEVGDDEAASAFEGVGAYCIERVDRLRRKAEGETVFADNGDEIESGENWTPGPWIANEYAGVESESGIWVKSYMIDSWEGDREWAEGDEDKANANLIASAPELYEALKELTEEAFMNMSGGRGDLIDQARYALAKARGEKR